MRNDNSNLATLITFKVEWLRWLALPAAFLMTLLLGFVLQPSLSFMQNSLHNAAWRYSASDNSESRVVVVAIDEKSIAELGAWPWSRDVISQLATKLAQSGVSSQAYDIVFSESKDGDNELRRILLEKNAVIAQVPFINGEQAIRAGSLNSPLKYFNCTSRTMNANGHLGLPLSLKGVKSGHISPVLEDDGSIKSMPPVVCSDGQAYMSLALTIYSDLSGATLDGVVEPLGFLQSHSALSFKQSGIPHIPLNANGAALLGFDYGPENISVFSASDVLLGRISEDRLRNRVALVGATAFGLGDVVPTPFSGKTPGVFISAIALSNLLDSKVPFSPRNVSFIEFLLGSMTALILYILGAWAKSRRSVPYVAVCLSLLLAGVSAVIHIYWNILLPWINVSVFTLILGAMYAIAEVAKLKIERSRILENFHRYMPSVTAEKIAYSLPSGVVEAERVPLVVLNADLRNFSAFEEKRPPEESAALLHMFYVEASKIIQTHGGVVHEFRGDALLAVWQGDQAFAVRRAILAAKLMVDKVSSFLPQQPPSGLEPLDIGVGIDQGNVLHGSLGPVNRRAHALLGDAVTLAIRIQEMTSDLSESVLVGSQAASWLEDDEVESQGTFILPGLSTPQTLFVPTVKDSLIGNAAHKSIYLVK